LIPSFQSKYVLHIAKMRKLNLISKSKVVDELIRRRLIARHLRSLTLNTAKPSEYSPLPEFLAGILLLDLDNDESHVVVLWGVGGESVSRLQDAIYHLLSRKS